MIYDMEFFKDRRNDDKYDKTTKKYFDNLFTIFQFRYYLIDIIIKLTSYLMKTERDEMSINDLNNKIQELKTLFNKIKNTIGLS